MEACDVIVVGGGISGLSFAARCARAGLATLLLERTATTGGCIQSHRSDGGFWIELGAHTCYNSYGALLDLLAESPGLGPPLPRTKAPFRVFSAGAIQPIVKELRIGELLLSAPRLLFTRKEGRTIRDYYRRVVGRRNYEHLFSHLFAAVPSQPADDMPAEMLFKRRPRRKDAPRSFTLRGGLQSATDALAATPGLTVVTGAEARTVARDGTDFIVTVESGASYRAPRLALATPPPASADLLRAVLPGVAALLGRIHVAAIRSVGVILRRDATTVENVAGIIPLDGRFFSAVSRDVVPDPEWRGFTFHFPSSTATDEALVQIAAVLGVASARFEQVITREVILPSPILGHAEIVRTVDRALAGTPIYVLGNYFGGLAIEDCVLRSQSEFVRLARAAA
ncbi:MAG: FAD-dependent oxidoreductase [Myxococcales bacterium]|nr:FAD-dependent oxidoreductase [Myxococcales bacterium]